MARVKQYQTSFNAGELDELLTARHDLKKYYQGASKIRNAFCMPQGGVRKRYGLKQITKLAEYTEDIRLEPFIFGSPTGVDQSYVILFRDKMIQIFDVQQEKLVASIPAPYSQDKIWDISFTQSLDTMIIVHPEFKPKRLLRTRGVDWSFTDYDVISPDYEETPPGTTPTERDKQSFTLLKRPYNGMPVYFTFKDANSATINFSGISTDKYRADDLTAFCSAMKTAIGNIGYIGGAANVTVTPEYTTETVYPGNAPPIYVKRIKSFTVTLSGSASGKDTLFSVSPGVADYFSIAAIGTSSGGGTPVRKDIWSDTNGWPMTAVFYENRLFFGGSKSFPSTLWGSETGVYTRFKRSDPQASIVDSDPLSFTLDTDQANRIQNLRSDSNLIIFTTGGEFYNPTRGITPKNFSVIQTSAVGSSKVRPVTFDNTVIYAQRIGNNIRDFVFDFASDKFISNSLSTLSSTIIRKPKQMSVLRASSVDSANYLYVVNGQDGTIAVFSGDRNQEVAAWSLFETDGKFGSVCTVSDKTYAIVRRFVRGEERVYLEQLNGEAYLDGYILATNQADGTIVNLNEYRGMTVQVVRGASLLDTYTVSVDGTIATGITENFNVYVGRKYVMLCETMPANAEGPIGIIVNDRKRITKTILSLFQTPYVRIIYDRSTREFISKRLPRTLNENIDNFTGTHDIYMNGISKKTQIQLISDVPSSCTILGVGIELEFSS